VPTGIVGDVRLELHEGARLLSHGVTLAQHHKDDGRVVLKVRPRK